MLIKPFDRKQLELIQYPIEIVLTSQDLMDLSVGSITDNTKRPNLTISLEEEKEFPNKILQEKK